MDIGVLLPPFSGGFVDRIENLRLHERDPSSFKTLGIDRCGGTFEYAFKTVEKVRRVYFAHELGDRRPAPQFPGLMALSRITFP